MLPTAVIFLSIHSGLNLLLAIGCLVAITVFNQNAPGLTLMVDESEIRQLDPRWPTPMNGGGGAQSTLE